MIGVNQTGGSRRSSRVLAAVGVAAAGAAALAALNHLLARRTEARHPPRGRFVTVDGVRLHYVERGTGPAIVLLHGNAVTFEDFVVSGLLDDLAEDYRVIAFDRPGYGYSERPRGPLWNAREQAKLLLRAHRQLGLESPVVVGHSWGALVAANMAADAPGAVAGVVLMSGFYRPTPRLDAVAASAPAIPLVGDVLRYTISPVLGRLLAPMILKWCFAPAAITPRFRRDYPISLSLRPAQLRASAAESAFLEPDAVTLAARLPDLSAPTLILGGRSDRLVSFAHHSEWLARKLPHARLGVIERGGHMIHHSATEEVSAAIREFVSANTASPTTKPVAGDLEHRYARTSAYPRRSGNQRNDVTGEGRNGQFGQTPEESTADTSRVVSSAAERDGTHYEPDPDQIVKVVHQVKPQSLPLQGPTDVEARNHADDTTSVDVRVSPARASVQEASPGKA
jgi:pimeloyl-ACP methyl ester carboxylesterase